MKKRLLLVLLKIVLWRVALLWCKTLNIKKINDGPLDELKRSGKEYVIAFWHGSMFVGWFLHRAAKTEKVSALVSQSDDGEFLSTILERWNYTMIRGSSHIGGKEAMSLMVDAIENGSALAITPDGPRGPRHEMKMGAVRLAQKTKVPLFLAGISMEKKRILKSWDQFELPDPFSSVIVKYGEPIVVPFELTGDELDNFKRDVEQKMKTLTSEAEQFIVTKGAR